MKSAVTLILMFLCASGTAAAQETRAEVLERERAAKAKRLVEYQPGKIERGLVWLERNNPLVKIAPSNGFYVQYGYSEKPIGSGMAIGGGWRHDLFDRNARAVIEVGQSLRGYTFVEGDFALTRLLDERLELGANATYRKEPQEDFYGLGIHSIKTDRTDFLFRATDFNGRAVFKPSRWLRAGARIGRVGVDVEDGTDKRFPDLSERFGDPAAPGFAEQPAFLYQDLFLTLDARDEALGARSGAYYHLLWRHHADNELERYSFDRFDADLQHFMPLLHEKRVIASRVRLITTTARNGDEVPFYFQPTLGGGDSLRSVSDFRFRDRNLLLLSLEYRFEAFSGMDMALFTDQGRVASRFGDLDGQMKGAYGLGFRFNIAQAVWLRIDVAGGGGEGIHTFFKFSGIF